MYQKILPISKSELKFDSPDSRRFSGYASVFDGVDSYGDRIKKGAYSTTLVDRKRPIKMRWNHFGPVIGKWLNIREDDVGLWVEGELTPGHSVASDVAASLQHKAIDGLSIGYYVKQEEMDGPIRVLKEIELIEISVVEEPADNAARIDSFKSLIEGAKNLRDVEACLRDACGLSRTDSAALVSRVKSIAQSDSGQSIDTSSITAHLLTRSIKHGIRSN